MKLALTLLLCLLSLTAIAPSRRSFFAPRVVASGGGGGASFSDDFNRADSDSLGANWTEADADVDISSNKLLFRDGSFATIFAVHNTSTGSAVQYVQFETSAAAGYMQIVFRYTDASTPFYYLEFGSTTVNWFYMPQIGGTPTQINAVSGTISAGSTISATITGSGDSTIVRIWDDATGGTLPSAADNWNGDTTPTATLTDNPATAVNSGNYVGLGCQQSAADSNSVNNFWGGGL